MRPRGRRQGRLVYARGFGYADVERHEPVQPDTLFRIASISKPITAAAILKLVDDGRLELDDRVFAICRHTSEAAERASTRDGRTSRCGRSCSIAADGIARCRWIRCFVRWRSPRAWAVEPPADRDDIVRFMLGQPLDFDPGHDMPTPISAIACSAA